MEEIVKRLHDRGHDVTVVSIHTKKTVGEGEVQEGIRVVRLLVEEGIDHPYVGTKAEEFARIRKFCESAALWFERNGAEFDVVHMHGHHMVVGYLAKLIRGHVGRTISTVHAVESLYEMEKISTGHSKEGMEHIKRLRELESEYRYADAIVAPSPAVKQQIFDVMDEFDIPTDEFRGKVHVVTSGIDEKMLMPKKDVLKKLAQHPSISGKLNVIILSRIDPSKGIQFAIRALGKLVERSKTHVDLSIVGRVSVDSYLKELREEGKRSAVDVEFHIDVSEGRKLKLLDDAQVYMLPTLQDTFGITLVEAGARGNIIVTTDTDGPMYVMASSTKLVEHPWGYVTNYGIYAKKTADPENFLPLNLSLALEWVLNNWDVSVKTTLAFQEKIRRDYMWDAIVRAYIELYG